MSYSNKKSISTKRKLLLTTPIALLLIGLGVWYVLQNRDNKPSQTPVQNSVNQPTEAERQQQADADLRNKQQTIESTDTTSGTMNTSIELTATQEANRTVTVFTKLFSITSGSCSLEVRNGQKVSNFNAEIVFQRSYSTCAGFSVPISELGVGTWQLNLNVAPLGGEPQIKTTTVEIK